MARTQFPMKTGGGILAKLIGVVIAITIVILLIKSPSHVGELITDFVHFVEALANGLANIINNVHS